MTQYKTVPVEPTSEMIEAARRLPDSLNIGDEWSAMLAAAPQPAGEPVAWQWLDTATFRKKIPPTGEAECWNPLYAHPQPAHDDTALLRKENTKLHGWIQEAEQAAGRLQRQVNADTALLRQVLDDICGAKLCEVNSMSSRTEMLRLMDKAIDALRERLK